MTIFFFITTRNYIRDLQQSPPYAGKGFAPSNFGHEPNMLTITSTRITRLKGTNTLP
jgi:hypothetical protein